jgi:uncharacterized membrane protein YfcA
MLLFGVEPRTAIATNMAVLVLMNLGSSLGFHGEALGTRTRLWRLAIITLLGSAVGAWLLLHVPQKALRVVVPCAMLAVLVFLLAAPRRRDDAPPPSLRRLRLGYGITLLLAIYGGFFSGGYVTMMVGVFTFFFGYTFLQAIALSRNLNAVSSLMAAGLFALKGAIDWQLAGVLGLTAFASSFLGARLARRIPEVWLRRIFVAAVTVLAAKSLIYDLR